MSKENQPNPSADGLPENIFKASFSKFRALRWQSKALVFGSIALLVAAT